MFTPAREKIPRQRREGRGPELPTRNEERQNHYRFIKKKKRHTTSDRKRDGGVKKGRCFAQAELVYQDVFHCQEKKSTSSQGGKDE